MHSVVIIITSLFVVIQMLHFLTFTHYMSYILEPQNGDRYFIVACFNILYIIPIPWSFETTISVCISSFFVTYPTLSASFAKDWKYDHISFQLSVNVATSSLPATANVAHVAV